MAPLFSIITVTFNAAATVAPTLKSVAEQTWRDYELIIIDGASTDNTLSIVRDCGISPMRIVSEPDHGLYDAMNKGLGMASGRYVMFLNAGDALHAPDTLALIARAVAENGEPGVVYGQTQIVDSERRRLGDRHLTAPEVLTYRSFADGMLVCHQAFVALRKITSNFDMQLRYSSDFDWCIRCLQHSRKNVYVPAILIDYLSEGLTTANRRKSLMERFRIMCRYYGTLPTIFRHFKFAARAIARRFNK